MTKQEAINILRDIRQDINYIYGRTCYLQEKTTTESESYKMDIEALDMAIEALQAEPVKHGKWGKAYRKTANGVDFLVLSCSECDNADPQMNYYDLCPNCGAKMDKE